MTLLSKWQEEQLSDYADSTAWRRTAAVERLCRHTGLTDPLALTSSHIRRYFRDRGLRDASRLYYLWACQTWAKWAGIPDPTEGIRWPKKPKPAPKPLTDEQLDRILDRLRLDRPHLYEIVVLGAYAGLRAFEVGKLRSEDIVVMPDGSGIIRVVEGKGGKTATVHVSEFVIETIRHRLDTPGPMYGMTGNAVTCMFRYWARKVGVKASFHQTRHWFGTETYEASGNDVFVTRDQMRHESIQTVEHYKKTDKAKAARAANRLPRVGATSARTATEQALSQAPSVHELVAAHERDSDGFFAWMASELLRVAELRRLLQPVGTL